MLRILTIALAGVVLLAGAAAAQGEFDKIVVEATRVSGNIYAMVTGAGGNIGVSVGDDGILIIDDQFAELAPKIRAALAGIGGGNIAFVLNTHWHQDHTSGNPEFSGEATIIAHHNVRKRLAEGGVRGAESKSKEYLPVITFNEGLSIHFNGEEVRAIHLPRGHTDGDCVVLFPQSKVAHLGDHMFSGLFPFVDLDSGGTVQGYIANAKRMLDELPADTRIIPGHGPLSTITELRADYEMMTETVGIVRERMSQGMSADDAVAAGLPDKYASYNWNFISTERWIRTIYASYSE